MLYPLISRNKRQKSEPEKPEKRRDKDADQVAKPLGRDRAEPPKPPQEPVPVNPPVQAPPPIELPAQIDLPVRGGNDHVEVAKLGTAEIAFDIRNPDGNPQQFQVTGGDDQEAWTITDGQNAIANLKREGGRINLYWADGANEAAECMRNALLVVSAGGDENIIQMRSARRDKAPTVDLDLKGKADKMTLPLDLELYGLDPSKLQFEVIGSVDAMTFERFDPATRTTAVNRKVRDPSRPATLRGIRRECYCERQDICRENLAPNGWRGKRCTSMDG